MYMTGNIKKALIVAPLSIVNVWQEELQKFAAFKYNAVILEGTMQKKQDTLDYMTGEALQAQVVTGSNSKKPDIHFAIHSNAGSGNNRGCEVYCHKFGGSGEKLARAVYSEIEPITPSSDRGVKEGCNHYGKGKPLYELAYTSAPAALIEIAYHDNKDDAVWIINNIEVIGTVIAKGILKYFDIPFQKENTSLENNINILNKLGIITSPDYWTENAVKGKSVNGEYVATLIKKAADILSK